ncbi:hypothetical protein Btru_056604 [Bulinus truncatus]|nr:hypothetical protein Btru_056604 [Bulinus truncatus]
MTVEVQKLIYHPAGTAATENSLGTQWRLKNNEDDDEDGRVEWFRADRFPMGRADARKLRCFHNELEPFPLKSAPNFLWAFPPQVWFEYKRRSRGATFAHVTVKTHTTLGRLNLYSVCIYPDLPQLTPQSRMSRP